MGRLQQKLTQQEVADLIHRSLKTYRKWERDETRPSSLADIAAVCAACGVPIHDYVTGQQLESYLSDLDRDMLSEYQELSDPDKVCVIRMTKGLVLLRQIEAQDDSQNEKN